MNNLFDTQTKLTSGAGDLKYYSLKKLAAAGFRESSRCPYSLKVLLESCLRNVDNFQVSENDVTALAKWDESATPSIDVPL